MSVIAHTDATYKIIGCAKAVHNEVSASGGGNPL